MNATSATQQTGTAASADLLLVRYALPKHGPKKVRDDVGKLIRDESLPIAEFDEARAVLMSAGFLTKGRGTTITLTDAGRQRALHFLGLAEMPPGMNWGAVVVRYLFPKAAGLSVEAAAKLEKGDQLAACILKRKYDLSSTAGSSVSQVLQAIVCKKAGFPEETTLEGLLRAVLSKVVESDERLTKDELLKQVPLFRTGLTRIRAADARLKLVRDWLTLGAARPSESETAEPFDLATFASTVRALANGSPPEDRFHDNKVFIAPLWRASQREPNFPRLSLLEFKQRLIEANARHLLHLSRADLVQAMDPHHVAESETTHMNAMFHFVLVEEARP